MAQVLSPETPSTEARGATDHPEPQHFPQSLLIFSVFFVTPGLMMVITNVDV